ncbi:MAG: septal ring lytic transglycosylase RlpA family protein [Methylotenera sp.]|uniref:septal ring lytic transglycosylase RlpA family protein n=1 Tax=Methylotenera sp. TaxID=2051956 RepID=UPI0027164C33|nr:septal ring lytic transglycosylase RlpA family protein [Methylotenera sp.]MDO9151852.1 septal ring lytic transglycosylase RlpA family protein [Methylotenera sp.]
MIIFQKGFIILWLLLLAGCASTSTTKPESPSTKSTPINQPKESSNKGAYYLDDGPGDDTSIDIASIPDAQPRAEKPLVSTSKPYQALGQKYIPMKTYAPYTKQGVASWYGKRYHGRKTSSGETYDMYGMSAAHTTLPIPSYVKVVNPANGREVVVRVNDRGPFKHDRLIDLSYAAAYKLGLVAQGSGLVMVTAIDTSPEALKKAAKTNVATVEPITSTANLTDVTSLPNTSNGLISESASTKEISPSGYYVQVGAFKNETNGELLQKKILNLDLAGNAAVTNVYNNGLHRVRLGPFGTKREADIHANKVRSKLNISAIVTNQ